MKYDDDDEDAEKRMKLLFTRNGWSRSISIISMKIRITLSSNFKKYSYRYKNIFKFSYSLKLEKYKFSDNFERILIDSYERSEDNSFLEPSSIFISPSRSWFRFRCDAPPVGYLCHRVKDTAVNSDRSP